jgi:glycosyltransferase involved in cell wall biosynthesis
MKKCVIAGDWILEKMVGIQRYTYQILLSIDKMIENNEYLGEIELLIPQNSDWKSPFKNITIIKKGVISSKLQKHIWQQIIFPLYVRRQKAIGIDLAAALPIFGCDICAIHDCIHEAYPENFLDHKLYQRLYLIKARCITRRKKTHIVTLTNDSKSEIKKYYNVSDSRLHIVSCGWEHMKDIKEDPSIINKIGIKENEEFFFSLGSRYKHKNYIWVLNVAKKNPNYKFVITGSDSFSNEKDVLTKQTPRNVIYTGYITDAEIKFLYKRCKAIIQPSLYEGFGLPPLEALGVGGKAIVSNTSCLPEIYCESVYYINPYKYDYNMDSVMSRDINNSEAILKKYTWENSAKQLIKIIKKVQK